jgi:prevent-host-death family protein
LQQNAHVISDHAGLAANGCSSALYSVLQFKKGNCYMRTLSADAEHIKLRELIEAARKEPVTVLENGEPAAVVLSPIEFERLDEQDRIRREAKARLRQTIASIHREASERGLTEPELERLLADES